MLLRAAPKREACACHFANTYRRRGWCSIASCRLDVSGSSAAPRWLCAMAYPPLAFLPTRGARGVDGLRVPRARCGLGPLASSSGFCQLWRPCRRAGGSLPRVISFLLPFRLRRTARQRSSELWAPTVAYTQGCTIGQSACPIWQFIPLLPSSVF